MKKQTYEEAVLKTVTWWSDKSFRTPFNQNNGDDSQTGAMTFMLMNSLAQRARGDVSDSKIKLFEEKLTELLMNATNNWEKSLDVDYYPCKMLSDAADYADIDVHCFPCKSYTRIDSDNKVFASYQYGGKTIEI